MPPIPYYTVPSAVLLPDRHQPSIILLVYHLFQLTCRFTGSIKNFGENGAWAYPWTAQSFLVPDIISGTGKATNLKILYAHSYDRSEEEPIKNFGNSSGGRIQELPKICRAPIYRAHCAVVFAIARLSC